MARGVTLGELVEMVRLETGQSIQPAQGVQNREHLKQMLRRVQETQYADFDWPILHVYREENLQPGETLYSWPEDIHVEDVRQLWDVYNGYAYPVGYGIRMDDRNAYGPDQRVDPVMRWQIVDGRHYEVWPTPATARKLAIEGYVTLKPMIADNDKCTLDGTLLVLFVAAEWLARNKLADAQAKLQAAQQLSRNLRRRLVSDKRRNIIPLVPGSTEGNNAVYSDRYRR